FTVTDDKATVSCPATASLAPLGSITCTASYTITQADLDAGHVTNTATGHATFNGNAVNSNQDSETVTATPPNLHITKTADAGTVSAGDPIGFAITVNNTGTGTATGVTVHDTLPTNPGTNWTIDTANSDGG